MFTVKLPSKGTLPSKSTIPSRSSVHLKESKAKASEELASEDKQDIDSQTIEKLKSIVFRRDREHKKTRRIPLDSY